MRTGRRTRLFSKQKGRYHSGPDRRTASGAVVSRGPLVSGPPCPARHETLLRLGAVQVLLRRSRAHSPATLGHWLAGLLSVLSRPSSAAALRAAMMAAALLWPRLARGDGASSETAWAMTPLKETFTVQQWSGPCGPPPVSGTLQPGGPATVSIDYGELVIATGHKSMRSDQCIDPLPTLAPQTHSNDGRTWRTRCTTPPSDPRHAVVNAAYFRNADDFITIAETGRYEFTVQGARCIADVTRESSLTRLPLTAAAPAPSVSTPRPTPSERAVTSAPCAVPGDAARLEVRPSRKLLRFGESYRFRAIVVDANGCPTTTPIQWSIAAIRSKEGGGAVFRPSIDPSGLLDVPVAMATEVKLDVVASAAGRSAEASVEVTSPSSYEQLLTQSGLDSNGERDEPAVALLATSSLGAASARAQDGARHRRALFLTIIVGLALALSIVGLFGALRMRKARAVESAARARHAEKMLEYERVKKDREERHASEMRAHLESVARAGQMTLDATPAGALLGPSVCPSCRREFAAGSTLCPFDSSTLVAASSGDPVGPEGGGGVCPTCARGYDPGVLLCPYDGEELVRRGRSDTPSVVAPRGKICPTCGERFEGNAAFCGKDGTQLVLLN